MAENQKDREVYIQIGDVVDIRDSSLGQKRDGKANVRCMIRDNVKRRRIQMFIQPEAQKWTKVRVKEILWVRVFPRAWHGHWETEIDIEAIVENAPDAEVTLVSENTPQNNKVAVSARDVKGESEFKF